MKLNGTINRYAVVFFFLQIYTLGNVDSVFRIIIVHRFSLPWDCHYDNDILFTRYWYQYKSTSV